MKKLYVIKYDKVLKLDDKDTLFIFSLDNTLIINDNINTNQTLELFSGPYFIYTKLEKSNKVICTTRNFTGGKSLEKLMWDFFILDGVVKKSKYKEYYKSVSNKTLICEKYIMLGKTKKPTAILKYLDRSTKKYKRVVIIDNDLQGFAEVSGSVLKYWDVYPYYFKNDNLYVFKF